MESSPCMGCRDNHLGDWYDYPDSLMGYHIVWEDFNLRST